MKRIQILVLFLLCANVALAQPDGKEVQPEATTFNAAAIEHTPLELYNPSEFVVINISLNNLFRLITMGNDEFTQSMSRYNYTKTTSDNDCYLDENTPVGEPLYIICKKSSSVTYSWSKSSPIFPKLKTDLEKYLVGNEMGKTIYKLRTAGRNYIITLESGTNGGGNVSIKKSMAAY